MVSGFKTCKCASGYTRAVTQDGSPGRCESLSAKPVGPYSAARTNASKELVGIFGAVLLVSLVAWMYFAVIAANMWRMRFYADPGEWEHSREKNQ
jgi:hypothetical protein